MLQNDRRAEQKGENLGHITVFMRGGEGCLERRQGVLAGTGLGSGLTVDSNCPAVHLCTPSRTY